MCDGKGCGSIRIELRNSAVYRDACTWDTCLADSKLAGPFRLIITLDTHSWFPPSDSPHQKALAYVAPRSHGGPLDPTLRVTVNFHPARLHCGVPLLRCFADDGEYRSQFETGTGNGSLSAFPGGERWHALLRTCRRSCSTHRAAIPRSRRLRANSLVLSNGTRAFASRSTRWRCIRAIVDWSTWRWDGRWQSMGGSHLPSSKWLCVRHVITRKISRRSGTRWPDSVIALQRDFSPSQRTNAEAGGVRLNNKPVIIDAA